MKTFSLSLAKFAVLSFLLVSVAPALLSVADANAQTTGTGTGTGTGTTGVIADANDNALVTTMCNVLSLVTGNAGKAFAAFAIISVGIGFFTGKVSWGLMIGVAAGIAAMFGAPTIVSAISGEGTFDCS